jgi:hypothetical protein
MFADGFRGMSFVRPLDWWANDGRKSTALAGRQGATTRERLSLRSALQGLARSDFKAAASFFSCRKRLRTKIRCDYSRERRRRSSSCCGASETLDVSDMWRSAAPMPFLPSSDRTDAVVLRWLCARTEIKTLRACDARMIWLRGLSGGVACVGGAAPPPSATSSRYQSHHGAAAAGPDHRQPS